MVKTIVAILGATGMLSLVAAGWNAAAPSAPDKAETSAAACQVIREAGLCERDLGGKCTPERCHGAKGCDPANCDPQKCDPADCPGHGPEGCDPARCHPAKQADSAGRPTHCNPAGCDPAKCDPENCPGHGPDGCDPSKCPGHGPEGCDPAKCPGHATDSAAAAEPEDGASEDAAPAVSGRPGGCSRACRGHGTSRP